MGFLSSIFSQPLPTKESIPAIMPAGALAQIWQGVLPTMHTNRIVLNPKEVCHFSERAILITEKTRKHYEGQSSSFSFRVRRGITYRTGRNRGTPIEESYFEQSKGLIYITNQRIIFVSDKKPFEKKLKNLTAITAYSNAVQFQFSSKMFTIMVPNGDVIDKLIALINQTAL